MYRKLLFLLVLVGVFVTGCSAGASFQWQDESVDLVWPVPPDIPRIRYLRSLTGPDDFKDRSDSSAMFEWWFGEQQSEISLYNPFAVSVGARGQVWVADGGARAVFAIDTDRREVKYFRAAGEVPYGIPSGIAVDNERARIYVADAAYSELFVLGFDGQLIERWKPEGGFSRPAGIALSAAGKLLVADAGSGKVYLFNPDGSIESAIVSKVQPGGRFLRPLSVAFGPNSELLILDAFAFTVEVHSTQGELLGTIGELGDASGYLARPRGVAVDAEGHVFVSDAAFDNIQVFDMAGNLLTFWGGAGRGAGKFSLPAGVFVDKQNRFFVADSYNHRVQVYQLLQ